MVKAVSLALAAITCAAACGAAACGGAAQAPAAPTPVRVSSASLGPAGPLGVVPLPSEPARPPEHWFFESLSSDGRRALLRRLDGDARSTLQTRVVDVESGRTLAEATFPELGKLPSTTIGKKPNEVSELFGMLTSPAFGDELVRGARIAEEFPFGTCGRFTTSVQGGPIAFNAGDWLYISDDKGHVQRRLTTEAAYDPRFTPDGTHLLFRRITGTLDRAARPSTGQDLSRGRYELFVMPADLSAAPRVLAGTAGARDRFAVDEDGKVAVAVASQEPQLKTCALQIALRPPFAVKKLACLDGGEPLVESVLSVHGHFVALTTQSAPKAGRDGLFPLAWRLRVVALDTGKVALDEPEEPGVMVRAISDAGLLVKSGPRGVELTDVPAHARRMLSHPVELGHRGYFRSPTELVVVRGGSVGVVDLATE